MRRSHFTSALPTTRCTPDMRTRVAAIATAAGVDLADVVRDALLVNIPHMELQLGLKALDDFDDEELVRLGLTRSAPRESREAGDPEWTPDEIMPTGNFDLDNAEKPESAMTEAQRRTQGLAWGPPVPQEQP